MRKYLLLFLILSGCSLFSQDLDFVTYSVEEGLSQSEARCVLQDSRGYLWIGTAGGGVNRYDGSRFREFGRKDGLKHNVINGLAEDSLHRIWLIGMFRGAYSYNGQSFTFYNADNGIGSEVHDIVCAADAIYFACTNGVYRLGNTDKMATRVAKTARVNSLTIDPLTRQLYFVTDTAMYHLNGNRLKLLASPSTVPNFNATQIGCSSKGIIYIGSDNGLFTYRAATKTFSDNDLTRAMVGKRIMSINPDRNGGIWISTDNALVVHYKSEGNIDRYENQNGMHAGTVLETIEDNTGQMWMATRELGLLRLSSEAFSSFRHVPGLNESNVFRIFEASDGTVWVGSTSGGVYKWNGLVSTPVLFQGKKFENPVAITQDGKGTVWIGHKSGMTAVSGPSTGTTLLTGVRVRAIEPASNGDLWIGTWEKGLFRKRGNELKNYCVATGHLPMDYVHDILVDTKGRVWAGTGNGLTMIEGEEHRIFKETDGLCNSYIGSIIEDKEGAIWFHTDLCVMRYDGMTFKKYDEDNGLRSSTVYLITFDADGYLWVGTNKGLDRVKLGFMGEVLEVRNYSKNEGFRGIECNSRSVCNMRDGSIWFGTVKGIIRFNPGRDLPVRTRPQVHITAIKLFLESIDWTMAGAAQQGWYNLPEKLDLAHDLNHLTFQFIGVYLPNPEKVRYKYMLVGFDSIWQPVTSIPEITYSNLPPGNYVFRVIASEDGVNWLSEPELSCPITIKAEPPALWKQWWFMLGHILLLAGLIYFYNARRTKRMHEQQEYLEQEVKERTQVIAKQNEEKTVMLMEIHHRVKNNLQLISSLLNIQADAIDDPKLLAHFEDLRHRVNSMALIHQKMYESKNLVNVDIKSYIEYLVSNLIDAYDSKTVIHLRTDIDNVLLTIDTIVPLGLILNEIISNSLKYAFVGKEEGELSIRLKATGNNTYILTVADDGVGLNTNSRADEGSLGMQLIRMLTDQLNGALTITSEHGTAFEIQFREEVKERF
jgi:two-component sensor histidine kinase/ligand-binding sensor domain-containing protein